MNRHFYFAMPERSPANAKFTARKCTRFFTLYDYRSLKETVKHVCRKIDFHQLRASLSNAGAMDIRHLKGLASSAKAQISLSLTDSLIACHLPRTILSADSTQTQIDIKVRLLQRNLKNRRKKAGMFKCPRVSPISEANKAKRVNYGKQMETLTQAHNAITL